MLFVSASDELSSDEKKQISHLCYSLTRKLKSKLKEARKTQVFFLSV